MIHPLKNKNYKREFTIQAIGLSLLGVYAIYTSNFLFLALSGISMFFSFRNFNRFSNVFSSLIMSLSLSEDGKRIKFQKPGTDEEVEFGIKDIKLKKTFFFFFFSIKSNGYFVRLDDETYQIMVMSSNVEIPGIISKNSSLVNDKNVIEHILMGNFIDTSVILDKENESVETSEGGEK